MQHVREIVTRSGRSSAYANEMAGLGYDIAYPHLDSTYRSRHAGTVDASIGIQSLTSDPSRSV
jgi:hypothetical protein